MSSTPWRIRLEPDDSVVIDAYQEYPRLIALGQCSQLFMLSSWQVVQRVLNKYKRG